MNNRTAYESIWDIHDESIRQRKDCIADYLNSRSKGEQLQEVHTELQQTDIIDILAHSPHLSVQKAILETVTSSGYISAVITIARQSEDEALQEEARLLAARLFSDDLDLALTNLDWFING